MVHLADTAVQLATVVRSVGFPGPASTAPSGTAVRVAYKNVLAIEFFETGTIRVKIRAGGTGRRAVEAPIAICLRTRVVLQCFDVSAALGSSRLPSSTI